MIPSRKNYIYESRNNLYNKTKTRTSTDEQEIIAYQPSRQMSKLNPNRHSLPEENLAKPSTDTKFMFSKILYNSTTRKSKMGANLIDCKKNTKENMDPISRLVASKKNRIYAISERNKKFYAQDRKIEIPMVSQCNNKKISDIKSNRNNIEYSKISLKGKILPQYVRHKTTKQEFTGPHKTALKKAQETNQICYQTCSIKGSKPINQDYLKCGNNIWILCDGHGQFGHEVSEFVAEIMFELLIQSKKNNQLTRQKISEIFTETEEILEESLIDITLSGSTCTLAVKDNNIIYIANIGDSPALLLTSKGSYQTPYNEHKPCNSSQRERIQFFGGAVRKHPLKQSMKQSPLRLWGTEQDGWGPGLAISRAFGDKMAQKYGLICQPSISEIKITDNFSHLIIGSDGLFDKLAYEQIQKAIQKQKKQKFKQEEICTKLANTARSRWLNYSDDVSSIVIYL